MLMLTASWALMMVLAAYLELVLPSAIGVKRQPCFCLSCRRRVKVGKHASSSRRLDGGGQRQHGVKSLPVVTDELRSPTAPAKATTTATATVVSAPASEARAPAPVSAPAPPGAHPECERGDCGRGQDRVITPALEARNLRVEYPPLGGGNSGQVVVAVESLDMVVQHGECVALLGPNGSGKSSAISAMCGLFAATSGHTLVGGHDMGVDTAKGQQWLGVCPQQNVLWPSLTVEEHMLVFGRLKGLRGRELLGEVDQRLKALHLHDARHRRAGRCSGGMQRRLSVGMATVGSPIATVLDEPSTGLDPAGRRALWNVIHAATLTSGVLLTTHSMEEAEQLSDRIVILANGQVLAVATAAQLKASVGTYVRLSVMATQPHMLPLIEARVLELAPAGASVLRNAGDCLRQFRIPRVPGEACMGRLMRRLTAEGGALGVSDWALTSMSMQEVFLTIIGGVQRVGSMRDVGVASVTASAGEAAELASVQVGDRGVR